MGQHEAGRAILGCTGAEQLTWCGFHSLLTNTQSHLYTLLQTSSYALCTAGRPSGIPGVCWWERWESFTRCARVKHLGKEEYLILWSVCCGIQVQAVSMSRVSILKVCWSCLVSILKLCCLPVSCSSLLSASRLLFLIIVSLYLGYPR